MDNGLIACFFFLGMPAGFWALWAYGLELARQRAEQRVKARK